MEQISVLKYLENIYLSKSPKPEVVKGLVIDKISKHKHGKYIKFFISNIDEFNFNNAITALYGLLYTNTKFKTFSRNKILDLKGKWGDKYFLLSKDCKINNLTTLDEFIKIIKYHKLESNKLSYYYIQFEIVIWKDRMKPVDREGVNKNESLLKQVRAMNNNN